MQNILIFIITISAFTCQGQQYYLSGTVTDAATGKPLHRTNISVQGSLSGTTTNYQGRFTLKIKHNTHPVLHFSYVGYLPTSIKTELKSDTTTINVQLIAKNTQLKTVEIKATHAPEKVYANNNLNVLDFSFSGNKLLLLTYGRKPGKDGKVILSNYNQKQIASATFTGEPQKIFKDYQGKLYIICKTKTYYCKIAGSSIALIQLPQKEFTQRIVPCIDTLGSNILFSNFSPQLPYFDYLTYNPFADSAFTFKHITDSELERMFRFEYYFLNPRDKLIARKYAMKNNVDKHEVAAAMTGFHQSLYYTTPYAPLFTIDDTIMIFDHYANKLYKIDNYYEITDSITISYHKTKKRTQWRQLLLKDDYTDNIYAVFKKNGYYTIKTVSTSTGNCTTAYTLQHKYVEHPKIKNDYIYYTYRPFESLQTKYLYRELIAN